ncbi:hypothetical protein ACV3SO_13770 [Clostridium perfringens]|nr:hypothetical protein [Clostridium perfringens]MDM0964133.1 hypothetical protein [Clostridium perfringens]
MTFNVLGFNQEMLLEIMNTKKIKLNSNDLLVLRNIVDMINRNSLETKLFDNSEYTWIRYSLLVENLPIISDKEDTFKKIVTKLIKCGFLKRKVIRIIGKGAYTYFKLTELLSSIEYKNTNNKTKTLNKTPIDSTIKIKPAITASKLISKTPSNSESDLIITLDKKISMITSRYPSLKLTNSDIEFINSINSSDLKSSLNSINDTYIYSFKYIKNSILKYQSKKSKFNNFTCRDYDYDILEKKLLGWDN